MSRNGIAAHTKRYYARLSLDKYMEVNRALDTMANKIAPLGKTNAIYVGASNPPPNCPIKIKKHVRAPGPRRFINACKKRKNVYIMKVDEWMTSQTCAKCFGRFDPRTKRHRFKVCKNCRRNQEMMMPSSITTNKGRHLLMREQAEARRLIQQNPVSKKKTIIRFDSFRFVFA